MAFKGILSNLLSDSEDNGTVTENYVKGKVTEINEEDVEIVTDNEVAINKKFSETNSLSKYKELGKVLIGMLKDVKNGVYHEVPWFTIATVVMALLYLLNPLDIIPDFIPGLGYIDDMAVLSIGMGWIQSDLHKYLDWKIDQGKGI